MATNIQIKVYGNVWPANAQLENALRPLMPFCEHLDSDEILQLEKNLLRLSFEGIYFPLDEVLEILKEHLHEHSQGKLDYIDLEEWTLTRHIINGKNLDISHASLNSVLDYSGH